MAQRKCAHDWAEDAKGIARCVKCRVLLSQRQPRATRPGVKGEETRRTQAPALDQDRAMHFAKLLHAGVPAPVAVTYCAPHLDPARAPAVAREWLRAPATFRAITTLNKARWEDLDHDARLRIALDKHLAELAYYLYTHAFETAAGPELSRLREARTAVTQALEGKTGTDNPFDAFLTDILTGKRTLETPPQLVAVPVRPTPKES